MTMRQLRLGGLTCKALHAVAYAIVVSGSALSATGSLACGYHNPQAIARGSLNWTFPKALYVRTALWQAESAGILPQRQPPRMPAALAFRRAALSLRMLADRLSEARARDGKPLHISVVLIDSMLWTRFAATSAGYTALVDVRGAHDGDVVVVTASKVIEAMVRGSLDASVAEAHGLIRLYRQPQSHAALRALLLKATDREYASETTTADASQRMSGE
jgi:hypothetical protein